MRVALLYRIITPAGAVRDDDAADIGAEVLSIVSNSRTDLKSFAIPAA
jgi:hypothetical protein